MLVVRRADAGTPVDIANGTATLLDPGTSGLLVGNVPGVGTPPSRPFKPPAGGIVRIFMTGAKILVCDELAPAAGNLSECGAAVRTP